MREVLSKLTATLISPTVNNAGFVHGLDKVGDIAQADIDGMFATNVFGLISMTQLLVKGRLYAQYMRFGLGNSTLCPQISRRENRVM